MKYVATLGVSLSANWLLWSGHLDNPFLVGLGAASCLGCLYLGRRMKIIDEEGAPVQLGLRPFTHYAPWLIKEIVVSNWHVAKIILSRKMPLKRNLITVKTLQKSELGRVIYANSITLTPGTVAVDMGDDHILVHALSLEDAAEEMDDDMSNRVCSLEGKGRES